MKQPTKGSRNLLSVQKKLEDPIMKTSDKELANKSKMQISMGVSKPEEHKLSTLENACTDLLEMGCVQSYIDLFYISHKCLPNVMEKQNYFGENLYIP